MGNPNSRRARRRARGRQLVLGVLADGRLFYLATGRLIQAGDLVAGQKYSVRFVNRLHGPKECY